MAMPAQALTYTLENASFTTPAGQISGSFDYTPTGGVTNFASVNVSAWAQGTQAQKAQYTNNVLEFSRVGSNPGNRQFFRIDFRPIGGLPTSPGSVNLQDVDPVTRVRCTDLTNCEGRPPRTEEFDVNFAQGAQLIAVPAPAPAAALLPLGLLLSHGRRRYSAKSFPTQSLKTGAKETVPSGG